ncbi:MAG: transcription factor S [Candidatus Aenigmatarchaeota archaeon]
MEFCDKCGGLLVPKKKGKKAILICRKCGKRKTKVDKKGIKITTEGEKHEKKIVVVERKARFEALPKTDIECPKCGNMEAYWWMQQTRSGDEPPTRFYRCTKCNHTWREYE